MKLYPNRKYEKYVKQEVGSVMSNNTKWYQLPVKKYSKVCRLIVPD